MLEFYCGTDVYRLRQAVKDRLAAASSDHSIRVVTVQAADELQELERSLKYPSFLDEHTFVVVRDALADAATAGEVHRLLNEHDAADLSDISVLVCQQGLPGMDSAALKELETYLRTKSQKVLEFQPLRGAELTSWIGTFCSLRGRTIRPDAAAMVARATGGDSWSLANELEKLCAYTDKDIPPETVRLLVPLRQERDDFQLANALAAGDKRGALSALWTRLQEGTAGQLLLGAVAYATRNLLIVSDLLSRRMPVGAIAKTAGLPPFIASRMVSSIGRHDPAKLLQAHHALAELDQRSKEGKTDIEDGLFSTIINL